MSKILIIQPYLPEYRRPFFERVVEQFAGLGHETTVMTGKLSGPGQQRSDATTADWHTERRTLAVSISGRHLRSYGSLLHALRSDVVVVELAVGAIDSSLILLMRKLVGRPRGVVMWGHVDSFTGSRGATGERVITWQVRNADAVLAYTEEGATSARKRGADWARVESLDNTVDLNSLQSAVNTQAVYGDHILPDQTFERGRTLAYIGGLDASKRINFLAEALDIVWERDQSIRVLVGGRGAEENLLQPAAERGQVVLMGRADDACKAAIAARSVALVMPGRVGLIAPESFVLGLPIITVDHSNHAPEFAYLQPGVDSLVLDDSPRAFADGLVEILDDPARLRRLREAALAKAGWPTIDHMVSTFVTGCLEATTPTGDAITP